eukprot:207552_1
MATFKDKRKQNRQTKVSTDSGNDARPPKRQRRGVSVFQRQLYKRKMWVQEYEAGKDQKRRDKRKVMRGYYRALKDLDRQHKQIFGHSVSTRSKRQAKKNGTNHDHHQRNRHTKDVWDEMRRPSYQQKYNRSNWKFMDTNDTEHKEKDKHRYKPNRQYRGNGIINFGNKTVVDTNETNEVQDEEDKSEHVQNKNSGQNSAFMGRVRLNSYQKASMEGRKIIDEREETQHQRELKQKQTQKALRKFEQQRKRRHKILSMKNKRGQPNLNAQIGLLLDKIKDKQNKSKQQNKRIHR